MTTHGALAGEKIAQISTGSDGACALDTAGAAYCWGDNDSASSETELPPAPAVPVAVSTRARRPAETHPDLARL